MTATEGMKFWRGADPKACAACGGELAGVFVDGLLLGAGTHGFVQACTECFGIYGRGAAVVYEQDEQGIWVRAAPAMGRVA